MLSTKILELRNCGSPYGALDAGAYAVRGDFHAIDVIGEAFQRISWSHLFESVRSKLRGLKQASKFVKGR